MPLRTLYVDTDDNQLVTSEIDPTPAPFPQLVQGDTISFKIFLLARNKNFPYQTSPPDNTTPYSIINNATLTLRVGIGPKEGTEVPDMLTSQFVWTPDALNSFFTGSIALNTAGIQAAIGVGESANAWFEIEITDANGNDWTVLQKSIAIQGEVIESGALSVPPGLTPLSAEQANAVFLKRVISGVFYLVDINNPALCIGVWNENGSLQTTPNIPIPS